MLSAGCCRREPSCPQQRVVLGQDSCELSAPSPCPAQDKGSTCGAMIITCCSRSPARTPILHEEGREPRFQGSFLSPSFPPASRETLHRLPLSAACPVCYLLLTCLCPILVLTHGSLGSESLSDRLPSGLWTCLHHQTPGRPLPLWYPHNLQPPDALDPPTHPLLCSQKSLNSSFSL